MTLMLDFLKDVDRIQFERLLQEKEHNIRRKYALHLITKLCSALWHCDKSHGCRVSEYLDFLPKHHELALYLAEIANIKIEEAGSHNLYIISFFAHIGVDVEALLPDLFAGRVLINGDPVKVDSNIEDVLDIDGYIVFDCALLNIKGEEIIVLPPDEYRGFAKEELDQMLP